MTTLIVPALEEEPWPTLGPQVCDFIEAYGIFGPGDLRGQPYKLDADKRGLTYRAYEIYPELATSARPGSPLIKSREKHPLAGRRRFQRVVISLRKGLAKTEWAALIAMAELHPEGPVRCDGWREGQPIGRGVVDPYIPMVAYTEEQTEDLAYAALLTILSEGSLARDFDIGLQRIMRIHGDGKAVALASSPDARDGARTTFEHFDEPLALDTPVPTTAGWKTIGEIQPGDDVYGRDGRAVCVMGLSPIHFGRPCYRVTFSDGESVVTDRQHRWTAIEWSNVPRGEVIVTTGQMLARGIATSHGYRWRLPRASGFDGVHADLPIDPYLLGLWLGDGSTDAGYINSPTFDYVELSAGVVHSVSKDARRGVTRWLPKDLRSRLRKHGLLGRKHIPDAYLFADRNQRLSLLRGLMDTDGHTTAGGSCTFVQKDRALCEQVALLVRSLGCNASITEQKEPRSRTGVMCKTHFSPAFCPFRLSRQAGKANWHPRRSTSWPAIVSIEPIESVPVRCLAVYGEDHLFLVGRGLHLTHNTHRFTLPRLKAAHRTMLANLPKRRMADAWSLETTTAYATGEGSVAEEAMTYARALEDGLAVNPRMFFFHRQASPDLDFDKPEELRRGMVEASGGDEEWHNIDAICAQFEDPTADRALLDRLWGNRPTAGGGRAFPVARFRELARDFIVPEGELITLGFDGARFTDAAALIGTHVATGHQWVQGLWQPPFRTVDKSPEAEEWEVPQADVDAAVADAFARWNVWRMYADPYWFESWVAAWQGRYGEKRVIEWRTNIISKMAYAVRAFLTAMVKGEITNDGDPEFTRHIGNACKKLTNYLDPDTGERMWLIAKERNMSPFKMDAAEAAVLSNEARNDALASGVLNEPTGISVYVPEDA